MISIRRFLLASLLSCIVAVIALVMTVGYFSSRHEAGEMYDAELSQYARLLVQLLSSSNHTNEIVVSRRRKEHGVHSPGNSYEDKIAFQVWNQDGLVLARSAQLPPQRFAGLVEGFHNVEWMGHTWRLFTLRDPDNGHWAVTGERDDVRGELATFLAWQSIAPILLASPLAALLIWRTVGIGLRPLRGLAMALRRRQATDLSPLPTAGIPKELRVFILSANAMLRRLAESFAREQRFAADAAHELRTPLAALMVHLENACAAAQGESREALDKTLASARRIQHVIEQLLALAKSTPEQYLANFARLDLVALVQDCSAEWAPLALARGHHFSVEGAEQAWLNGDRTGLSLLLRNLLHNAIHYTPAGGSIVVDIRNREQGAELRVIDTGPGIPAALRTRVFDRFYRVGGDRHDSEVEGAGLGLSIVKYIADLHRARLTLSEPGGHPGLEVLVSFPLGAPSAAA